MLVEGASALVGGTWALLGQRAILCLTEAQQWIRWRISHDEFLRVAEYCYELQTWEDDVCGACSTHRRNEKYAAPNIFAGVFNRLTPNDPYMGRTAPLTSKRCILYIYSTNIGTECFKHTLYSPFFSLQNAVCFIMLTCLVPVLFTFYIQDVLKLKKK